MGISYKKLWVMLIQKDITKSQLRTDIGLSAGTMSKLNKGEEVALSVLLRICDYLECDIPNNRKSEAKQKGRYLCGCAEKRRLSSLFVQLLCYKRK